MKKVLVDKQSVEVTTEQDNRVLIYIGNKYLSIAHNDIGLSIDVYHDVDDEPISEYQVHWDDK